MDAPKKTRAELQTWTLAEAARFLETARTAGSRYYPLFATALNTGKRLGELLGVRWADVDLDAGTVVVQQTLEKSGRTPRFGPPKTKDSRRTIPLLPELVDALRHWKATQNGDRLLLGPAYRDFGLVFTIPGGGAVSSDDLRKRDLARLVKQARVPAIRSHDLRHCYASTLLAAGVPLKTVSDLMGHSTVGITADVYGQLTLESKREAVGVLSRVLANAGAS